MTPVTLDFLTQQLELGELLLAGQGTMFQPQDLPGRYGRVVAEIDRVLEATSCPAVLGGGWAVWRHGFFGRMTQDIDIVLPADQIDEFLYTAAVSGFEVLATVPGRWPKIRHKETDVMVDIFPRSLCAAETKLGYISLPALIEMKLAADRLRDDADIVELLRANPQHVESIAQHLAGVHPTYASRFGELVDRAAKQEDR